MFISRLGEDNFRTPTVLDKMVQTNELDEEEFSQLQIMNLDNDVQVEAVAHNVNKQNA